MKRAINQKRFLLLRVLLSISGAWRGQPSNAARLAVWWLGLQLQFGAGVEFGNGCAFPTGKDWLKRLDA
jgi:hypothetical protein